MARSILNVGIGLIALVSAGTLLASQPSIPDYARIPDEYEAMGDHSLAFGNAGVAALSGVSAVRANPAMIAIQRQYNMSAGYYWPAYGRNFYQLGVVDAKTSSVAAGLAYTGFSSRYEDELVKNNEPYDSPVSRRLSLALANVMGNVAVGIQGTYLNALEKEGEIFDPISSTTLGFGIAGLLTPSIRFALSGENINNRRVKAYAPTTYRAGVAMLFGNGDFTVEVDARHRERVLGFENEIQDTYYGLNTQNPELIGLAKPEEMAITAFSARVYDLLRLIGSYGVAVGKDDDRSLVAGGLALVHQTFSISYSLAKPYRSDQTTTANINFNIGVAM